MGYLDTGIYAVETWTDEEAEILRRYFTNLDGPVFALVNLPEVVKGALFARYSRSAKSLRRLFAPAAKLSAWALWSFTPITSSTWPRRSRCCVRAPSRRFMTSSSAA